VGRRTRTFATSASEVKTLWRYTNRFIIIIIIIIIIKHHRNSFGRFKARPQGVVTPLSSEDDPAAAADAVGAASEGWQAICLNSYIG